MRPATYEPEQIIEAGLALQAEGRNITEFALRNQMDGDSPTRLHQIWDEYQTSQGTVVTEPAAKLSVGMTEEVKAISAALSERITQLATELNDKTVWAAEQRIAEVIRAAGGRAAQARRGLVDAAQTVDDLEEKLDELQDGYDRLTLALESERTLHQQQDAGMAQLRECLAAAEEDTRQREERYQEQKTILQNALNAEQTRHKNTQGDLQKRLEQVSAGTNARAKELKSGRDKADTLLTCLESQENALVSERQQHQITRETLQRRLKQTVADARTRAGELALKRDRVSNLTARLESQEKTPSEQLVRMSSEIASLADHYTQLESQCDNARLETMGEKEMVATPRGETEALKRQNQSLVTALSGNKQTGGQDAW